MLKAIELMISIDLGNESAKCGYAYKDGDGNLQYGSLKNTKDGMSSYPTSALYLESSGKWVYGYESENNVNTKTYTNIKDLLCLLNPVDASNRDSAQCEFYANHKSYFRFAFPARTTSTKRLADSDSRHLFKANLTPKAVCEKYYNDLFAKFIVPAVKQLIASNGIGACDIKFMSVYPAGASEEYIVELERLTSMSCGNPAKYGSSTVKSVQLYRYSISTTKALASFIQSKETISKKSDVLIADISATQTSVSKVSIGKGDMLIDGADGHSEPIDIGGKDYDELVQRLVDRKVNSGAVLGGGADADSLAEQGTYLQQYFMLKNIRYGKQYFGDDTCPEDGVPFDSDRDILSIAYITGEEFADNAAMDDGVSSRIVKYIIDELNRSINNKVAYLVLAGGASATYGLIDLLKATMKKKFGSDIELILPDNSEEMLYAAAIGGAIWPTDHYVHKMCAPLSYGSWSTTRDVNGTLNYHLDIMISKGEDFKPEGDLIKTPYTIHCSSAGMALEFFSANTLKRIIIGEPGSDIRRRLERDPEVCLKCILAGRLKLIKGGIAVRVENFEYVEIFKYDRDGRATIAVESGSNTAKEYKDIKVEIVGGTSFSII